jgi:predicted ArsR family transcriptional regulator
MNLSCCKKWMTEKIDELGQEVQVLKKQKKQHLDRLKVLLMLFERMNNK